MKSLKELLAGGSANDVDGFLDGLSDNALAALPHLFEHWALDGHQRPPGGDWNVWVILGGRGAGKTRAGAEWVRAQVEGPGPRDPGLCRRVALVGETLEQAREVMVLGESGILACSPPDRRPEWQSVRRRLVWPNGAVAEIYSASDPERLRGPQFDAAWADELAKWKRAEEAWDMLQFTLRLGSRPRQVVTTTPRNQALLRSLLEARDTVVTQAPTSANRVNLAPAFLEKITARYAGTTLGRQELDGVLLGDDEDALWTHSLLDTARGQEMFAPQRIVVAVDPPMTSGASADECGIIVAGAECSGKPGDWRGVVLEDASLRGAKPVEWMARAVEVAAKHKADCIVAEVNQGGELVESLLRQVDATLRYKPVRASRGKQVRAEPVAALYEQGRIGHAALFADLEDQMTAMRRDGFAGRGSPDRVDALVWALTELILEPAARWRAPRIRSL
ncbi:DNA-packaging protein [Paracoccaceae bacterium GXU_MW_L88]